MPKQMCLYFLLFLALTSRTRWVLGKDAPGDTVGVMGANRYATHPASDLHQHTQQHPAHHAQAPQVHHTVNAGGGGGGGGSPSNVVGPVASHALYHVATPGSGQHVENRNSYNLLSEAMSQAVTNEFSSLGSGSADGACHADDLDCYSGNVQDRLGMEAIRTLHRQLDDDDNGNIDLSESDDFLREELKYDSGYEKRQKAFHFNDDMHISVKELWEAWLRSEVHNWTIEQTTDWLAQSVQLPQYVELFKQHKVTGAALPRLAVNNMHYVGNVLGIKDPIHKQKIALKAMDVVLFGPPRETGTRWKDYILVTLLLSAIIGCWYAYQQNKNAKRHLRRMAQDMEGLQRAEQSLQEMQKELERARMEQENVATEKMDLERRLKEAPSLSSSSSDLEVQQLKKEIEMLRTELSRAEIELVDNCWAPPPQLQSWLQYTYELENKNHMKKRISAEKQLQSAREACEKLRKKRTSFVGAFVSTHGKSIDDVDRSIVEARNSLGEVTNELQERLHRWKQIESCLGLNIVNNNGLAYLESVLYGRSNGGASSKGSRGRMTSSTDDLDDDSVQGMLDSYSRSSASGGLGGSGPMNSGSTTNRDDSSCSEDGADNQSVQFYLGNAPPTPIASAVMGPTAATQRAPLPLTDGINHIGNNVAATPMTMTPACASAMALPGVAAGSPTAMPSAPPPPLPPHSNAPHTIFTLNDSPMLRSQSSDILQIYTYHRSRQQQQQQQQQHHSPISSGVFGQQLHVSGAGYTAAVADGSGAGKKMVKQHSTASQQSTSSTSSSVQSAPPAGGGDANGKGQSPGRWSSHERIMPVHEHQFLVHQHQHQHLPQYQQPGDREPLHQSHISAAATASFGATATPAAEQHMSTSISLQSLCGKPQYGSGSGTSTTTSASAAAATSPYGDTRQAEEPILRTGNAASAAADTASIDGSIKKRKRRLRFPFGGSKKSTSSSGGGGKNKPT